MNRVSLPKVGAAEPDRSARSRSRNSDLGGRNFRHNQVTMVRPLDKLRNHYERKVRQMMKHNASGANEAVT